MSEKKEVVIRNKRRCLLILRPSLRLAPGVNRVSVEEFNKAKEHYGFQKFLDAGYISIQNREEILDVDIDNDGNATVKEQSLKNLDSKKAIKAVNLEKDAAILQRWLEQEERASVKSAIERRLEVLLPTDM